MEAKIETPKRVETIKEEIEKVLTTNPKYTIHGTKWFEKTHNQFYWNTDSNHDWLTEEGFKTAHYRRKLLEQEKRKVRELQGIADRGQYDLKQHEKFSKKTMEIMDDSVGKKVLPMVVAEPSLGVGRAFLVFMFDSFYKNEKGETVLKLNPKLSPIKAAVFPLVKNDKELVKIAEEVYEDLKQEWNVIYDASGSVGRRYARNDEAGTPFCITIDSDSIIRQDVTIRDRNTTKQIRVKIKDLKDVLRGLVLGEGVI